MRIPRSGVNLRSTDATFVDGCPFYVLWPFTLSCSPVKTSSDRAHTMQARPSRRPFPAAEAITRDPDLTELATVQTFTGPNNWVASSITPSPKSCGTGVQWFPSNTPSCQPFIHFLHSFMIYPTQITNYSNRLSQSREKVTVHYWKQDRQEWLVCWVSWKVLLRVLLRA